MPIISENSKSNKFKQAVSAINSNRMLVHKVPPAHSYRFPAFQGWAHGFLQTSPCYMLGPALSSVKWQAALYVPSYCLIHGGLAVWNLKLCN